MSKAVSDRAGPFSPGPLHVCASVPAYPTKTGSNLHLQSCSRSAPVGRHGRFALNLPSCLRSDSVLRKVNTLEPKTVGDQFALLVSSVVDYAIFMLDPTGRIVTWNDGAQRIKGYTADEVIGRHFSLFYPPEEARSRKPDWELEVAKREGHYTEEGWRLRKDGTRFWASVAITALRDQTGRLRGFGKVTRDLTERREQEEARNAARDREEARLHAHADRMAELERTKPPCPNLASHELRGPPPPLRRDTSMPPGGESWWTTRNLGSQVSVIVRDQGLGIAAEHMRRLFARFGRLPTEENVTIHGTGLGLFLCKEIATRHGGDITAKAEPGAGSEFTLILPAAR